MAYHANPEDTEWKILPTYLGKNRKVSDALEPALLKSRTQVTQITLWTGSQKDMKRLERPAVDEPGQAVSTKIQIRSGQLADKGVGVKVRWVPGHKGVEENEKADKAAKTAAEGKGRKTAPRSSISHLKTKSTQAQESETAQWLQVKMADRKSQKRYRTTLKKNIVYTRS